MLGKPYTRTATVDDCAELALTMREADRIELAMGGSSGPYASLVRGVATSENPLAVINPQGEVVAILGVVPMGDLMGSPWMLAADGLEAIKWPFLRECRAHLAEMHNRYPFLHNHVWEGNTTHIRWLKWLGFTVGDVPARPHFLPFWKQTNHV
jgi:hypothetical protein